MEPSADVARLLEIMARLRTPETGCPWDLQQTFATIAPYTIEEAYEVADAIARNDLDDLKDELGDLLLQVVFHARMAEEDGRFAFGDVVEAITRKLIRRHPHVFGDDRKLNPAQVNALWEEIKAEERQTKPKPVESVLDGVPLALPALSRAEKIQKKAARVGFDWQNAADVTAKVLEEVYEVSSAASPQAVKEEIGDLLFAVVNLARRHAIDAETALRDATNKFERRFRGVERRCQSAGQPIEAAGLLELERLWQVEKAGER